MYSMIAVILKLKRNIHVEDLLTRVFPKRRSTETRLPQKTSYHNLIPVKKMLSLKLSVLPCLFDHYSKTANRKEFRGDECYIKTLNIIKKKRQLRAQSFWQFVGNGSQTHENPSHENLSESAT